MEILSRFCQADFPVFPFWHKVSIERSTRNPCHILPCCEVISDDGSIRSCVTVNVASYLFGKKLVRVVHIIRIGRYPKFLPVLFVALCGRLVFETCCGLIRPIRTGCDCGSFLRFLLRFGLECRRTDKIIRAANNCTGLVYQNVDPFYGDPVAVLSLAAGVLPFVYFTF